MSTTPKELPSVETPDEIFERIHNSREAKYRQAGVRMDDKYMVKANVIKAMEEYAQSILSSKDSELAKKEEEKMELNKQNVIFTELIESHTIERTDLEDKVEALEKELQSLKQSQAKPGETVLLKRSIKLNGLPTKEGRYIFWKEDEGHENGMKHSFEHNDAEWFNSHYDSYYIETTLPRVEEKLPTEEEINNEIFDKSMSHPEWGITKIIIEFLKSRLSNTNPQNDKG